MKTKLKTAIIAIAAFLYIADSYAQDYYSGKTTVSGDNVTYNIVQDDDVIYLNNADNELTNLYPDLAGAIEFDSDDAIARAFRETFTAAELSELQSSNESIFIQYDTGPSGNVLEVSYAFFTTPAILKIKPDRFYTLEQKIKLYDRVTYAEGSDISTFFRSTSKIHLFRIHGEGQAPEDTGDTSHSQPTTEERYPPQSESK